MDTVGNELEVGIILETFECPTTLWYRDEIWGYFSKRGHRAGLICFPLEYFFLMFSGIVFGY